MRIFNCDKLKWDNKFVIGTIIALILSIISGIVLFKLSNFNNYAYNFADIYIFYIFNFKNGQLFLGHILSNIFYFYSVFLICYFTKLKALGYILLYVKALFGVFYCAVLFAFFGSEGMIVALIVFIPSFLVSLGLYLLILEQCRFLCRPFSYFAPAVCGLISSAVLMILVNLIFRVVVVIV